MRKLYFLLLLAGIGPFYARAQSPDSVINQFFTQSPNQQVYLQFDNNAYFPGDTVWYKGYVVDNGVPSLKNKTLYVDWFNGQGHRIAQQVLPVLQGLAACQFPIPASLTGKRVYVTAYTRWMLNDSSSVFHRSVTLLQLVAAKPVRKTAPPISPSPQLQFYPEGGILVRGVLNKVAFKAIGQPGSPIRGVIKDEKGDVVARLKTSEGGMGYFYFTPLAGTYTAEWTSGPDTVVSYHTSLPVVQSSGIAMEVQTTQRESLVTLRKSSNISGWYYLLATFYGSVTYLSKINLTTTDSAICHVPIESFPDGSLTLTILDTTWTPIGERLLFIRGKGDKPANEQFDLSVTDPVKRLNQLTLHYTGTTTAHLSISITDATVSTMNMPDMNSYLSFSAPINESGDLAALTSTWKHNDWKAILKQQPQRPRYGMDTSYFSFSGKATNAKGKADSLAFFVRQKEQMFIETADMLVDGSFHDPTLIIFDSTRINFQHRKMQKQYEFEFEHLPASGSEKYAFPLEEDQNQAILVLNKPDADAEDLTKRFGKMLQAAFVTAPKKKTKNDSLENVYESNRVKENPGYVADLHESIAFPTAQSMFNQLTSMLPSFPGPGKKIQYFLDEAPITYQAAMGALPRIVFVKWFPRGNGTLASGDSILVMYTEKYNPNNPQNNTNYYQLNGYSLSLHYDTVSYQPGSPKALAGDLRKTLYWNPSVGLDTQKNTFTLDFTNNDLEDPIRIIIEGIDDDGNAIHLEKTITTANK